MASGAYQSAADVAGHRERIEGRIACRSARGGVTQVPDGFRAAESCRHYWVERGDPAKDELFLRWCAQMMRAWRHNAAELLNLDSPEQEWPFDTEGLTP